jgi:hypothetical protein
MRKPLSVLGIFLAVGLLFGVLATSAQWTGPTAPPPNGNPTLVNGSGTAGQVTFWQDNDTLTGDTGLTFNGTTNILTATGDVCAGGVCLTSVNPANLDYWGTINVPSGTDPAPTSAGQTLNINVGGGLTLSGSGGSTMTFGVDTNTLQTRIDPAGCPANNAIRVIAANGSVTCQSVTGSNDITTINGVSPISVSGSGNNRDISLSSSGCSNGEVWTYQGSGNWSCDAIAAPSGPWTRTGTNVHLTTSGDFVGIGTASPSAKLHVAGSVRADDGTSIFIGEGTSAGMERLRMHHTGAHSYLDFGTGNLYIRPDAVTANAVTITPAGRVGIGTTGPATQLAVKSAAAGTDVIVVERAGNTTRVLQLSEIAGGHGLLDMLNGAGTHTLRLHTAGASFFTGGALGLGTSAPSETLDVRGGARIDMNATYDVWIQGGAGASGDARNLAILGRKTDDRLLINYGTEYSGGTIIGGTTDVTGSLTANSLVLDDVANNGRVQTTSNDGFTFFADTNNNGADTGRAFRVYVNAGCFCAPGTTALSVLQNGDVHAGGFFYTSDRRTKTDIRPLTGALAKVLQLEGVSYTSLKTNSRGVGLIAQDVEKIFPEVVAEDPDSGLKTLNYGQLVGPMIEAIKEQQQQIEVLEARIEQLESDKASGKFCPAN